MIKLRTLLSEMISNIDLGQDIHSIIESKNNIDTELKRFGSHLIKVLLKSPSQYDNGWENTLRNSLFEIFSNPWFKSKKRKQKEEYLNTLKDFNVFYSKAVLDFNKKLNKNESPLPQIPPKWLKIQFEEKYTPIIDDMLNYGIGREQFVSIKKIIQNK
jgi:hypothetical protein